MKILIADDHKLFRETLAHYIRRENDNTWGVECVENLDTAIEKCGAGSFDLVVLDWRMPGMKQGAGITTFKAAFPDQAMAVMSGVANPADIEKAKELGALGFLPKTMGGTDFVAAIGALATQKPFVSDLPSHITDGGDYGLTEREQDVFNLVVQGLSNQEIATRLSLALVTVKLHMSNVLHKTQCDSRSQLIAREG